MMYLKSDLVQLGAKIQLNKQLSNIKKSWLKLRYLRFLEKKYLLYVYNFLNLKI